MSSSDSVATATENASRFGYKHVCVNYLHVTSHDYQYQEVTPDLTARSNHKNYNNQTTIKHQSGTRKVKDSQTNLLNVD